MELIKRFEQRIEVQCYSPSTLKTYKYQIKKFIRRYKHDLVQENIEPHLLYLKKEEHYSPESLNLARAAQIYFFEKILKKPITIDIPIQKRKIYLPRPVDRHIIKKLIDKTTNLKHKLLIEFAYSSGLRPFELVKVKWEDVDLNNKLVWVHEGKGRKDRYSIISKEVVQHLSDYKSLRENQESKFVFDSRQKSNTHITKKTYEKVLETASKKARLGFVVTPYRLRHSFGTHCLEEGINLRYVQSMLGHNSPKTTMRYTQVTKFNLAELKSPLDNINKGIERELGIMRQNNPLNLCEDSTKGSYT